MWTMSSVTYISLNQGSEASTVSLNHPCWSMKDNMSHWGKGKTISARIFRIFKIYIENGDDFCSCKTSSFYYRRHQWTRLKAVAQCIKLRIACWRLEKIIPAKGHVRERDPGVVLCEPCENIWRRGCERRFHNWCLARMKREWRVNCPPFRLFFSFHQHKLFLVSFHLRKLFLSESLQNISPK